MPARRMNSGVISSGSPNQKATTSSLPMPALATSRIFEERNAWTAGRADRTRGFIGDGFIERPAFSHAAAFKPNGATEDTEGTEENEKSWGSNGSHCYGAAP